MCVRYIYIRSLNGVRKSVTKGKSDQHFYFSLMKYFTINIRKVILNMLIMLPLCTQAVIETPDKLKIKI